ncbi:hypothetical protein QVA66_03780 [Staphylococcus chromogenes]|nr:hypothetical protein [Staphylococcus chromogenes]
MYEYSTPAVRQAAYWRDIADRRLRLVFMAVAIGLVLGFVFHAIVAAPPVWIDQLPETVGCGAS